MELLSLLLLLFPSLPCAFSTSLLPISPSRSRSQTSLSVTGGDKRLEENSKLSGLLRKSGTGGIVHQRGHAAAGGREQCSAAGKWAHSAPVLAAPRPAQIKRRGRGSRPQVPPGGAGGRAPAQGRGLRGETSAPGRAPAELQAQEPLAGLSVTQICPFAKRSLRKHLGQCRPSSQITFLPNYSPISPRPVLNFARFGSGAELAHQEPSRTALCQGILQVGPWLLLRLPCMRQSEECSPRSRESPAAENTKSLQLAAVGRVLLSLVVCPETQFCMPGKTWKLLPSLDINAIVTSACDPAKCQSGFRITRSFLLHRNPPK